MFVSVKIQEGGVTKMPWTITTVSQTCTLLQLFESIVELGNDSVGLNHVVPISAYVGSSQHSNMSKAAVDLAKCLAHEICQAFCNFVSFEVVRSRSFGPLYSVKYLDLSSLGIVTLDGLKKCVRLQTLNMHGNNIEIVQNLASCYNLWRLNLSNCKVSNLDGLSKFIALGSLNLVNNDLDWSELMKIRHMRILDLSLHGNKKLEKEKYYRIHVIDSLPNVWTLDGRIVTSAERTQVENFFQVSALSKWPVRHKLTREQFVPSSLKKIEVNGIYGDRTTHCMMRFPTNSLVSNIDTDRRRLKYLSYCLQKDLQLEVQHRKCDPRIKLYQTTYMESLMDARAKERDRCNILLLLLVASLEFKLPTRLLEETLSAAKLTDVGGVETIDLFLIPREHRYQIAALLLSAVKVERDEKKDGGLYDQLYLSLYHTIAELHKRMHAHGHTGLPMPSRNIQEADSCNEFKSLLAAEVVQVFCIVPVFFDYITKDSGIMRLVSVATADNAFVDKITELINGITAQGGELRRIVEEVADFLISALNKNTKTVLGKRIPIKSTSSYILSTPRALPRRPQSSPVHISKYLAMGRPSPDSRLTTSRIRPATAQVCRGKSRLKRRPRLGDKMLLAPQNLGYIIALPECDVALVQMDSIPASNGSVVTSSNDTDKNYCYIDMAQVIWEAKYQYWKPVGTIGDRITIRNVIDIPMSDLLTSPRTDATPPSSPQEDQQQSVSPVGEIEDLPSTVSVLLRDRLKISPLISIPEAHLTSAVTNAKSVEPKEKNGLNDEVHVASANMEAPHDEALLYDCLRCAVNTVKSNNAVVIPRHEKRTGEGEQARRHEKSASKPGFVRNTSDISSCPQTIEVDLRQDSEMLSDYQVGRTEEWRKSSSRPQSSKSVAHSSRSSTPTQGRYCEPCGSPVLIQTANDWLAGGLNVHHIERLVSRMKLHHTPGWLEGMNRKRPQSVGPHRTLSHQKNRRRTVKSAGAARDTHRSTGYTVSHQPPPSPASTTDINLPVREPDYLHHARHHNFTATSHPIPIQRSVTPPYGGPHRPPSPLSMQIK